MMRAVAPRTTVDSPTEAIKRDQVMGEDLEEMQAFQMHGMPAAGGTVVLYNMGVEHGGGGAVLERGSA